MLKIIETKKKILPGFNFKYNLFDQNMEIDESFIDKDVLKYCFFLLAIFLFDLEPLIYFIGLQKVFGLAVKKIFNCTQIRVGMGKWDKMGICEKCNKSMR